MKKSAREYYISMKTLIKLFYKNIFSAFYFLVVGIVLSVIYTQFLVKATYVASGNIENTAQNAVIMSNIASIATEQETVGIVVDRMNIAPEMRENKKTEIIENLTAGYNTTTFKVVVSYSGTNSTEVVEVVNKVIDVTLERYLEINPTMTGKIKKQSNPIVAVRTGLSNRVIYISFALGGLVFGTAISVGADLINRKIFFESDLEEYGLNYNVIDLKLTKQNNKFALESEEFTNNMIVLQDKIEGAARRKKAKVIGVSNLGYDTYDNIGCIFAENLAKVGLKTLIIDLDLEYPRSHMLYNVDNKKINVTNILTNKAIEPLKIKDYLYILPANEYTYPARFLKDERLYKLIENNALKYDYVIINVPTANYYASIMFNFGLLDILLINTSFEGTKMKTLDAYVENIEFEYRDKLFLNGIDGRVKRDYSEIINRIKGFFKRNKKTEEK